MEPGTEGMEAVGGPRERATMDAVLARSRTAKAEPAVVQRSEFVWSVTGPGGDRRDVWFAATEDSAEFRCCCDEPDPCSHVTATIAHVLRGERGGGRDDGDA